LALGFLLFIADKFGDLSLQEPESLGQALTTSSSSQSVQVSLINEAQLRHRSNMLGEADQDLSGDKADHNQARPLAKTDPIYQSLVESASDDDRRVYMVG
jgi:hypothetical protein